ncbi:MFS transporter [Brachybacterium sacelli]
MYHISMSSSSASHLPPATRRRAGVVVLACAAQFMVVLDVSIVNVALPTIQADLGFSPAALQWVVNAYVLAFAGLLLLGGRLADIYGRRRVFLAGLMVFSMASLIGGIASHPGMLMAARTGQGVGAAVLAPATLTLLTTSIPRGPARTRALAAWTAVGMAGGTAGNLIGGALTEFLSWRWILLVNVPIGTAAVLATFALLGRDGHRTASRRLDIGGAILATVGLTALTFGLSRIESERWADPSVLVTIGAGVVALAGFVFVEARVTAEPLMPLGLFTVRSVAVGNLVMVLAGAAFMPMWVFLTLTLQQVLGYTALQTGLAFLPHTLITMLVTAKITPWLMGHVQGRTLIVIGALLAAAGFVWQSAITADSGYISGILGPAIVFSAGSGLLITPVTTAVTSDVADRDAGAASGIMNTARQAGGAIGLAVLYLLSEPTGTSRHAVADGYANAFVTIAVILIAVATLSLALPTNNEDDGQDPVADR